jgi:IS30 family transposase
MQKKPKRFFCIIFLSEGRRKEVKALNGYSYLTLEQRREIERMYAEGERVVDIAARLKRSAAAIYEELKRGYTGELDGYARPSIAPILHKETVQEKLPAEETTRRELLNTKGAIQMTDL